MQAICRRLSDRVDELLLRLEPLTRPTGLPLPPPESHAAEQAAAALTLG